MNTTTLQTQIEALIWRWALAELAIAIIAFGVLCWVSYLILKLAIRDGIREGMPRGRVLEPTIQSHRTAIEPEAPPGYRWQLIKTEDFRATERPKV